MVDFRIVSRSNGRNVIEPYEQAALKDVATLGPKEQVTVAATFAPFAGLYMFHCHNAIHEDHAMMDAFNVTQVHGSSDNASDLQFEDPMNPEWRAKSYASADAQSSLQLVLQKFATTGAYNQVDSTSGAQRPDDESSAGLLFQAKLLASLASFICALIICIN